MGGGASGNDRAGKMKRNKGLRAFFATIKLAHQTQFFLSQYQQYLLIEMEVKKDDIVDAAWTVIIADTKRKGAISEFTAMMERQREQNGVKPSSFQSEGVPKATTHGRRGILEETEAESAVHSVILLEGVKVEAEQNSRSAQSNCSITEVIVLDEYEERTNKRSSRKRSKRALRRRPDVLNRDNCLLPLKRLRSQTNQVVGGDCKKVVLPCKNTNKGNTSNSHFGEESDDMKKCSLAI